jgi:hypothetical protein
MRIVLVAVALLLSAAAGAKAPPGQGRVCDAAKKCDAGLQCVGHRDGKSTCEIVCVVANAKCPEDQRCVKDGAQTVCRPISDL